MKNKNVYPGTISVIFDENRTKVLLHQLPEGIWSLTGGRPDFGETWVQTTVREVKEETGFDVKVTRLIGVYSDPKYFVFSYPDGNTVQAFAVAVECKIIGGEKYDHSDESLSVDWFDINNLPETLKERHRIVIHDAMDSTITPIR